MIQLDFLWAAPLAYGAAFAVEAIRWVFPGRLRKIPPEDALLAAWGIHALGILLRWAVGGILRPPVTGFYESLQLFVFTLVGIQAWAQLKLRMSAPRMFVALTAFLMTAAATTESGRDVAYLEPSMRNLAFFLKDGLGAASLALLYWIGLATLLHLLKQGLNRQAVSRAAAWTGLAAIAWVGGPRLVFLRVLEFPRSIRDFEGDYHLVRSQVASIPLAGISLYVAFCAFAAYLILELAGRPRVWSRIARRLGSRKERIAGLRASLERAAQPVALVAIALTFFILALSHFLVRGFLFTSHPQAILVLTGALAFGILALATDRAREPILAGFPAPGDFLAWQERWLLLGFLLMGASLLAGTLWSHWVWGRMWAGQLSEACWLGAWTFYAALIRMQRIEGWPESRTQRWALLGILIGVIGIYALRIFPFEASYDVVGG